MTKLKETYNCECPDCGDPIDEHFQEGDDCLNCGHVFFEDQFLGHNCEH